MASELEYRRRRHRRRAVYLCLALAYGLQRILQPCVLQLLPGLLADGGAAYGPLAFTTQQARHLPLWVGAALPAAVLADMLGPAAVLSLSLCGSAVAVLLLPLAAAAASSTVLGRLLAANSLMQGAVFPCIVALQARYIPSGRTDDIWASRTLGVGAVVAELLANAAPAAWVPALGATPRRWRGTTAAVVALGGLLGGCGLLVAAVASQRVTDDDGSQRQRKLPLRAILVAGSVRSTLFSALAAGSALGAAEFFLPAAAVQQGMALVRFGDLGLGWLETRLRTGVRPMGLRRVRQLASTLGPIFASVGLLCLVPGRGGFHRYANVWPGLAAFCLFFQSPLGFGAGFGCSYREVGGHANAAVVGALGSLASTLGAALGPRVVMWVRATDSVGWGAAFGLLVAQQVLAAASWWRMCDVRPIGVLTEEQE